jgi:hypothetical protein
MRRGTAERQGRIEFELMEERAAALPRISQTLESLIQQLQALRERIGVIHWSSQSPELVEFRELRRRAVRHRWYLAAAERRQKILPASEAEPLRPCSLV